MNWKIPILIILLMLFSCTETIVSEVGENDSNNSITELVEEVGVIEEQEVELSNYQLAIQKHEKSDIFPLDVVIQSNDQLYDKESLNFQEIIKTLTNCFVLEYRTHAAEVENIYYLTFDFQGNQLDAALVNTYAVGLDGEIVFNTDTTFQVYRVIKKIEWHEADIVEVGEPKTETVFYEITTNGIIIKKR
jgi:hypothetical protein